MENLQSAKYIIWLNNGTEGWSPVPVETLKEAVEYETLSQGKVITKGLVKYEITEVE